MALLLLSGAACSKQASGKGTATSTTNAPADAGTVPADPAEPGSCPSQAQVDELNARTQQASDDADAYSAALEQAVAEVSGYLPADRAADFRLMTDSLAGYLQVLGQIGDVPEDQRTLEQQQRVEVAMAAMRAPEVQAAAERVGAYFGQSCPGIDFESTGP